MKFALSEDQGLLQDSLNKALAQLKADGTYDAIVKKWFSN